MKKRFYTPKSLKKARALMFKLGKMTVKNGCTPSEAAVAKNMRNKIIERRINDLFR